jgi:hypothetical protein
LALEYAACSLGWPFHAEALLSLYSSAMYRHPRVMLIKLSLAGNAGGPLSLDTLMPFLA